MSPTTTHFADSPADLERTEELLHGARKGDERSWARLFHAHRPYLLKVLQTLSVKHPGIDVEAVLQDALVSALRGLPRFEYRGPGTLRAWLCTIAVNRLIDAIRRSPPTAQDFDPDRLPAPDGGSPDRIAEDREQMAKVYRDLETLSPRDRDVVILRWIEKLTWDQIVEYDGRPRTTLRRVYYEARVRMGYPKR